VTPGKWTEYFDFQGSLWKAMALDPIINIADKVQLNLSAVSLNRDLQESWNRVVNSAKSLKIETSTEFKAFEDKFRQIMQLRQSGMYTKARSMIKSGFLSKTETNLLNFYERNAKNNMSAAIQFKFTLPEHKDIVSELVQVREVVSQIRKYLTEQASRPSPPRSPSSFGSTQKQDPLLVLLTLVTGIMAFFMGANSSKRPASNPPSELKLSQSWNNRGPSESIQSSPGQASARTESFNYSKWLDTFESLLVKIRSNSSTFAQALKDGKELDRFYSEISVSLYLIRNEKELETFKTSFVEFNRKLSALKYDRLMSKHHNASQELLSHFLKLCDAVESGIPIDRTYAPQDYPSQNLRSPKISM
jgi:hypothetical protein